MAEREALVFINFEQALRFGHVAWGFAVDDDEYFYGSTDHLLKEPMWYLPALWRYSHVPPGGNVDFWCGRGPRDEMLAAMASGPHIRYHACKSFLVETANVEAAVSQAKALEFGGWSLFGNNCVDQAAAVLVTYGVAEQVLAFDSALHQLARGLSSTLPVMSSSGSRSGALPIPPVQWFDALKGTRQDLVKVQLVPKISAGSMNG